MFAEFAPNPDNEDFFAPGVGNGGTNFVARELNYDAASGKLTIQIIRPVDKDIGQLMQSLNPLVDADGFNDQLIGEAEIIYDDDNLPSNIRYSLRTPLGGNVRYEEITIGEVIRDREGNILSLRSRVHEEDWAGERVTTRQTYILSPEQTGLNFHLIASIRNEEVVHEKVSGLQPGTYLDVYAIELEPLEEIILHISDGRRLGAWATKFRSLIEPEEKSTDLLVTDGQDTHIIKYPSGKICLQVVRDDIVIHNPAIVKKRPELQIEVPEEENAGRESLGLKPLFLPDITLPVGSNVVIDQDSSRPNAYFWKGHITFPDGSQVTLSAQYDPQRNKVTSITLNKAHSATRGSQIKAYVGYNGARLVGTETSWCDTERNTPNPNDFGVINLTNMHTARTTVIELEDRVMLVTLAQEGSQRFESDAEVRMVGVRTIKKNPDSPVNFVVSTDGQTITLEPDWPPPYDHQDVERQFDIPLLGEEHIIYYPDERTALEVVRRGLQVTAI